MDNKQKKILVVPDDFFFHFLYPRQLMLENKIMNDFYINSVSFRVSLKHLLPLKSIYFFFQCSSCLGLVAIDLVITSFLDKLGHFLYDRHVMYLPKDFLTCSTMWRNSFWSHFIVSKLLQFYTFSRISSYIHYENII